MNTMIIDGLSYALPLLIIACGGIFSERSGGTNLALKEFLGWRFHRRLVCVLKRQRLSQWLYRAYVSGFSLCHAGRRRLRAALGAPVHQVPR